MSLESLAAALRDEGGLLAGALAERPYPPGQHGERVRADLRLVVEAIREGYELHYGTPRVLAPEDDDLALLAGDRLYALGLEWLARIGDLHAVAVLADLISDTARAHAERTPAAARAAWQQATAKLEEPNR